MYNIGPSLPEMNFVRLQVTVLDIVRLCHCSIAKARNVARMLRAQSPECCVPIVGPNGLEESYIVWMQME